MLQSAHVDSAGGIYLGGGWRRRWPRLVAVVDHLQVVRKEQPSGTVVHNHTPTPLRVIPVLDRAYLSIQFFSHQETNGPHALVDRHLQSAPWVPRSLGAIH